MLDVVWTLVPSLPTVTRPCPRCAAPRPHLPTGAFRVNAHRKRLDVWLLWGCAGCGRTWKSPVLERVPVRAIAPDRLERFHRNDPTEVRACALLLGEGQHPPELVGTRPAAWGSATRVVVHLRVPEPVRTRLDVVLAQGLGCSRGAVARAVATGALEVERRALRRPPRDRQRVGLRRAAWSPAESDPQGAEPADHAERLV